MAYYLVEKFWGYFGDSLREYLAHEVRRINSLIGKLSSVIVRDLNAYKFLEIYLGKHHH
jgi:hypothetical protein